jgi:hypothetical protein
LNSWGKAAILLLTTKGSTIEAQVCVVYPGVRLKFSYINVAFKNASYANVGSLPEYWRTVVRIFAEKQHLPGRTKQWGLRIHPRIPRNQQKPACLSGNFFFTGLSSPVGTVLAITMG